MPLVSATTGSSSIQRGSLELKAGARFQRDQSSVAVTHPASMVLEAVTRKLSIPELFHLLDEKLGEECSNPLSFALSTASIESKVHSSSLARLELRSLMTSFRLKLSNLECKI